MARLRRPQPLLIRITHAVLVPTVAILFATGVELWSAYPFFGPLGATYDAIPLQGLAWPSALRVGSGLGAAHRLHLVVAALFALNAVVYASYLVATRRRFAPYPRGKRALYLAALGLAALQLVSGLALWKPVQLAWLGLLLGGYDGARVVHYFAMLGLLAFVIAHVMWTFVDVRRHGWRKSAAILTGGAPEEVP